MSLRAGDLRERIEVRRFSGVPDEMGGASGSEALVMMTWARVRVPSAKDGVVAMKDAELRTHEILIRMPCVAWLPRLGDVVVWNGARLIVKATRPTDRGDGLFLDCVTEV